MDRLTLDAVLGAKLDVDVCTQCRAFWFEPFETLHLTPASTLRLFSLIVEGAGSAGAFPATSHCPKCGQQLRLAHDRQRNTPFTYYRCDAGHGRFMPFVDFLREKDFIKPLSPQQINELRQSVQTIHCGNCGAPIDLTRDSACSHCGAALSMLDLSKVTRLPADASSATTRPPRLNDADIRALFAYEDPRGMSLIDLGLRAVAKWLG